MNRFANLSLFPWLTFLLGAVGYGLRLWLLASLDENNLLQTSHPAGIICIFLLLFLLFFYFLVVRNLVPIAQYGLLFPRSPLAIAGNVAAGAGFLYSGYTRLSGTGAILGVLFLVMSILATLGILYAGFCRLKGQRCHYMVRTYICFYLMLHLVFSCRSWGSDSQVQMYLFPLLASLFLVLASYYRTVLDSQKSDRRPYIILTQSALFCCMLSLKGDSSLYYLAMAFWMATDCCNTKPKPARYLKKK
ncbi:MAG: hypothetical protein IJB47_00555 [Oscillospiraceae bacterium]|nr:hypothetical protein [Oscillospiraceae bacterium]